MQKKTTPLHTYLVHLIPGNIATSDVEAAHDAGKLKTVKQDAQNGEQAMVRAARKTGLMAFKADRDDGTDPATDWLETDFDNAAKELQAMQVRRQGAKVLAKSLAQVAA